jgi:hypothetical protein
MKTFDDALLLSACRARASNTYVLSSSPYGLHALSFQFQFPKLIPPVDEKRDRAVQMSVELTNA